MDNTFKLWQFMGNIESEIILKILENKSLVYTFILAPIGSPVFLIYFFTKKLTEITSQHHLDRVEEIKEKAKITHCLKEITETQKELKTTLQKIVDYLTEAKLARDFSIKKHG